MSESSIALRAAALLTVTGLAITMACGEEERRVPPQTPPSWPPTAEARPSPTPRFPAPIVDPASTGSCPINDADICAFALDVQGWLKAGNLGAIVLRLAPEIRLCAEALALVGDDIGCRATGQGVEGETVPVVAFFNYGSDCCYKTLTQFSDALGAWLDEVDEGPGEWRVYGVISGSQFWGRSPSLLFVRGGAADGPAIEVDATKSEGRVGIRGIIKGTLQNVYVFPDAELVLWK